MVFYSVFSTTDDYMFMHVFLYIYRSCSLLLCLVFLWLDSTPRNLYLVQCPKTSLFSYHLKVSKIQVLNLRLLFIFSYFTWSILGLSFTILDGLIVFQASYVEKTLTYPVCVLSTFNVFITLCSLITWLYVNVLLLLNSTVFF